MKSKIWVCISGPFFLFSMISIIKTYNYKFDVTGWRRFISYHGVNLQFMKMNRMQWQIFSQQLAPKYFKIAATINLIINLIILLFISNMKNYTIVALIVFLSLLSITLVSLKIKIQKYK